MEFTLELKAQGGWAANLSKVQKIYGLNLLKFVRKVSGLKLKHEVIAGYKEHVKGIDVSLELTESEVMQMEHWFNDRSHREIYIEDSTFNAHIHLDVEIKTNMETGECLAAIPFLRIDQDGLRAAALAYAIDLYNK
jgi:hypothetical protein